jgi:hypothetical protein
MAKSPYLKKNKPSKTISAANKRKQKFAIWSFYKKKNEKPKSK